jgi:hypothetical protein
MSDEKKGMTCIRICGIGIIVKHELPADVLFCNPYTSDKLIDIFTSREKKINELEERVRMLLNEREEKEATEEKPDKGKTAEWADDLFHRI